MPCSFIRTSCPMSNIVLLQKAVDPIARLGAVDDAGQRTHIWVVLAHALHVAFVNDGDAASLSSSESGSDKNAITSSYGGSLSSAGGERDRSRRTVTLPLLVVNQLSTRAIRSGLFPVLVTDRSCNHRRKSITHNRARSPWAKRERTM